jgi:dGTPase
LSYLVSNCIDIKKVINGKRQNYYHYQIHGLRVVDKLAELDRSPRPGLNLTYEVRDGIISHCGEDFVREIVPSANDKILEEIKVRGN